MITLDEEIVVVQEHADFTPPVPQEPQAPQPPQPPQPVQGARGVPREIVIDGDRVVIDPQAQGPQGDPTMVHLPPIDLNPLLGRNPDFPVEAMIVSVVLFVVIGMTIVGWPIARAIARRMDRKTAIPRDDADLRARLERIEQAVEAVAIEVERISEGQRFTTKMLADAGLADRAKLPAGRLS
jgi:hypothetical protein